MAGRWGTAVLACLLALTSASCAGTASRLAEGSTPGGTRQEQVRPDRPTSSWQLDVPTLLVENRSGYQVGVYLDGTRIGTATTGRSCIRIPKTLGELRLVFASPGSQGFAGPVAYLQESRHWRVKIMPGVTIKYDVLGMRPTHESCEDETD